MLYFIPRYRNLFPPTIHFIFWICLKIRRHFSLRQRWCTLPEMVSYDIAVIAKLMLWDTMFDKSRHRLQIYTRDSKSKLFLEYLTNNTKQTDWKLGEIWRNYVHSKSSITALFLENGRNWRTDNLKCNFQPLLI
jgi:hypothetical protein